MQTLVADDVTLSSNSKDITSSPPVSPTAQNLKSGSGVSESPRSPLTPSSLRESPNSCNKDNLQLDGLDKILKTEVSADGSPATVAKVLIENEPENEELRGTVENGSAVADVILHTRDSVDIIAVESSSGDAPEPRFKEDSPHDSEESPSGSRQVSEKERDDCEQNGNAQVDMPDKDASSSKATSIQKKQEVKGTTHKQHLAIPEGKRPPSLRNGHRSFEGSRQKSNQFSPKLSKSNDTGGPDGIKRNGSEGKGKTDERRLRLQIGNNATPRSPHVGPARLVPGSPYGLASGNPHRLAAGTSSQTSPRSPARVSSLRPLRIIDTPAEKLHNAPWNTTSSKSSPRPVESTLSTPKSILSSSAPENKLAKRKIIQGTSDKERAQRKVKELLLKKKTTDAPFSTGKSMPLLKEGESDNALEDDEPIGMGNPDMGPFLLKLAKSAVASGDDPYKALEFAARAAKSFERSSDGKPSLDHVRCLHILAAIHCSLGQFEEAIPVLQQAIAVPNMDTGGLEQALAKFAGHMQLGDTFALLGRSEDALAAYHAGLEVQKRALGDMDPRVGETCRYLAEAHVQAMQFARAEDLCAHALEIHKEHSSPASVEESTDRRLMGLILNGKGEYEAALEHLVLASMALIANEQEVDIAAVDVSIGDTYVSLGRFDEAVFSYQKALTIFKSAKGENHASVASVYVSLAELYLKTGKLRESRTYCDSALRIYSKQGAGHRLDEIASGLTEIAAVYEALNEQGQALSLLLKALGILESTPGQQSTAAGIEAQVGVLYFIAGNFEEACTAFQNAVSKLRVYAEKKSSLLGIVLNQLGLAFVQLSKVEEAAVVFEEARNILEESLGPYHPDTLAIYSNLAGAYDALGRLNEAIQVLEYIVEAREEKLGTANPEVDDERRRLAELLKEAGRSRTKRLNGSLELLMQSNTKPAAESGQNISANAQGSESIDVQKNIELAAH